ncbi:MAG: WG repeat-containing protein [Cetobacterium sp.]
MTDCYSTLGVSKNATDAEIKKEYRKHTYGLADENYNIVLPAEYDSISEKDSEGYRVVKRYGYYGILDESFNIVVPIEYDSISDKNSKGYRDVEKNRRTGVMDKNYNVVLSEEKPLSIYEDADAYDTYYSEEEYYDDEY